MPLTHLKAPAPTKAIHVVEVQTASDNWADRLQEYVDTLLWRLWYPRTVWRVGVGDSVHGKETAIARLDPAQETLSNPPDGYTIGSGPIYTTAQIASKAVLLALSVRRRGPHEPVLLTQGWFDGVRQSIEPPALAQPPPPTEPVAPAGTLTPSTFRERAQTEGTYSADLLGWYIRRRWRDEWWPVTQVWAGEVLSVDVPNKRADVRLDALPASGDTPTVTCGWGWRKWTKATLDGKHVRVMFDGIIGVYVDDTNP